MKNIQRNVIWGLLWLAFCAIASATPSFTIQSNNFSTAGDGGGFSAYLNGNTADSFEVFCADYMNYVYPPETYSVNIDVVGETVANTRYGATTTFNDDVHVVGAFTQAQMQYILAGWLTTQYVIGTGSNGDTGLTPQQLAQNSAIQYAIWDLLTTSPSVPFPGGSTEVTAALNWAAAESVAQLQNFAGNVDVFTSTSTTSYNTGVQEMISVSDAPEPAALAMVGGGLLVLGLLRRKKSQS